MDTHDQFVLVVFPAMQVAVSICVFTVVVLWCTCVLTARNERHETAEQMLEASGKSEALYGRT